MNTLEQIEAVVDSLPVADQQQLLVYLAARLRGQSGRLPASRQFSREEIGGWIAEDETDLQRLRAKSP